MLVIGNFEVSHIKSPYFLVRPHRMIPLLRISTPTDPYFGYPGVGRGGLF